MPARRTMGSGVTARRVVATADVAARLAHPQVNPARAHGQALLAAGNRLGELEAFDRVEVAAGGHEVMVTASDPSQPPIRVTLVFEKRARPGAFEPRSRARDAYPLVEAAPKPATQTAAGRSSSIGGRGHSAPWRVRTHVDDRPAAREYQRSDSTPACRLLGVAWITTAFRLVPFVCPGARKALALDELEAR